MWRTQAVKRSWSCWRQSCSGLMYQPHSLLQPWRQRNCHLVVVENLSWNNRRHSWGSSMLSSDSQWRHMMNDEIESCYKWNQWVKILWGILFMFQFAVVLVFISCMKVSQLPVKYRNDNWWDYLEIIMERLRCPRYRLIPGETGESHNYHYHQVNWYKGR